MQIRARTLSLLQDLQALESLNFLQFSLFLVKNFTFTPMSVINPTLDPFLGTVTYDAKVTRLGAIGHGAEI
jgi:hypothetical protein